MFSLTRKLLKPSQTRLNWLVFSSGHKKQESNTWNIVDRLQSNAVTLNYCTFLLSIQVDRMQELVCMVM